jgi:hypothetical protein
MDDLDRMEAEARAAVDRIQQSLTRIGLKSVAAPPNPFGSALGVPWSPHDFTVISVHMGDPGPVNLVSAVLRGVSRDQAILGTTNRLTRDNALFPCVLHEAAAGWDVLMAQRFPEPLLVKDPQFLQLCVEALPQRAAEAVPEFAAFGGRRPEWGAADLGDLVTRSLM